MATDQWNAPGIQLRIDSPFGPIPEPGEGSIDSMRRALLPTGGGQLLGFECIGQMAMATEATPGVRVIVDPDLNEALKSNAPHLLFSAAGIEVRVPAGEKRTNPWVVRNLLSNFVRHYSYVDELKEPGNERLFRGGISFTHDMGVANRFSPPGHSAIKSLMANQPGRGITRAVSPTSSGWKNQCCAKPLRNKPVTIPCAEMPGRRQRPV